LKDFSRKVGERIGYSFQQPELLQTALTHRSFGSPNNERLEFLGDAVLSVVVSEALFLKFPETDEGSMSRLRASLVNGETLAVIARRLQLGDFLSLGPGELKSGGFRRDSILAGALEAVIGAVYLEGGFEAARRSILAVFRDELEKVSLAGLAKDPKTQLQEYLQARRQPLPDYRVTAVEGRDHEQRFRVECQVAGLEAPVKGEGGSRRKAEQDAAAAALRLLQSKAGSE
jgi:ribonuclease-3